MVRNEFKKINISLKQSHLIDIFANTQNYLELGTISIDSLIRLLNYEMVQLEDISYLPIQNFGIGKSDINDKSLKSIVPYIYYQNINRKYRPLQVFITHGIIKYKDFNNKEVFSPLLLIPVNIYFENERVFFQQVSEPIENIALLTKLQKERKINIPTQDKLDNIFNIDRYFSNFEKHPEFIFQLENYLTFSNVLSQETVLNQNKFNLNKTYQDYLYENLYNLDSEIYYSKKYNRNQRYALSQALEGKSFVITGRLGTGKTTVLKDIAINAIANGKRVLYVSNIKETLDNVYNFFKSKQMHYYVTNFTNSFASFYADEIQIPSIDGSIKEIELDELLVNYQYISDYQHRMTGRILDYRFIDVINELLLLQGFSKTKLEIDNLDQIYKFEYLEILNAIKNIQTNLKDIDDFNNSIWKDIPIINDIKYPNQVISLVHKVHSGFLELNRLKTIFETNYGFKPIGNYAYFKNTLSNIKNLEINKIPKSWYERENYENAKTAYHKLKTLIFTLQELEYDLSIRYDDLDKLDIKEEISKLYGNFFTKNDIEKINKIISDRLKIVVLLNKAMVQIDIFNKASTRVKKMLNYDFNDDDEIILDIIKLAKILLETNINKKIITTILDGKLKEVQIEATNILNNYNKYNLELEKLFKDLPVVQFGSLEQTIGIYSNFEKGLKVRRLHKRIIERLIIEDESTYKLILARINKYYELKVLVKKEDEKFMELLDYHPDQVYIDDLIKINEKINSIKNPRTKSRVLKFLKRTINLDEGKNKNYYRFFDYYQKSYSKLNNLYDDLLKYEILQEVKEFDHKLKDIQKINAYIKKSFSANDYLHSMKKINKNEYITVNDYLYIDETQNKIKEIKQELKTNKDFSYLFGNMYNTHKTDLSNLSKEIQIFKLYSDCFMNDEVIKESLNPNIHLEIQELVETSTIEITNLNEFFKLYFKIFKNSVSKLYYGEFLDNINHMNKLIHNKEILITYLKITENLQVLAKYQLYKLIEYIIYLEDPSTLVNDFKYTYLSLLKDIYLEKFPYLSNYKAFEANLNITIDFEDEVLGLIENNTFQKIRKKSANRSNLYGVRNLDYNTYIRRTSNLKHLILSNTQIVNNFLNIKDFDLVLIDDAQLFDANKYYNALNGEQVIIAGKLQLQEAVANNLISRISLSKSIVLNYRYNIMPKSLQNFTSNFNAPIYKNYYDNHGVEVITKDVFEYIAYLYKVNKDYKISVFVSSLVTKRNLYDQVTNLLLENDFSHTDILDILLNNLSISDLKQSYLIDSDYNIVYLEDYYNINEDYLIANMIDNLLLCKNKLIVYDNNEYLEDTNPANFIIELQKVIDNKTVFSEPSFSSSMNKLIDVFKDYKIICYNAELCSFLIRVKSNVYGITIYWDSTKTNYDILNEFRDIHSNISKKVKKNFIVWAMELIDNFDGVIERIIKEANND